MKLEDFIKKIEQSKKTLIAQCRRIGLVPENFGQKEVRKINDLYYENFFQGGPEQREAMRILNQFEDWCMNYRGET